MKRMRLPSRQHGLTMVELLAMIAILGLFLTLATPRYWAHLDRSREVMLRHHLTGMRDAIDRFHAERERYPRTLQELVVARYLASVPNDPMTERADTWALVTAPDHKDAIYDVRSGADGAGPEGIPYASW